MKSKVDSGRMISRVTSLQEENECLHAQIAMLKEDNVALKKLAEKFEAEVKKQMNKIAMQEKEIAILKRVCHGSVQDCKALQNLQLQ